MTLKTTTALLAAISFLATPIGAQAQNTTNQTAPAVAAVNLAALQAACTSDRAYDCEDAAVAAMKAYLLQGPTPAQINEQIGLIAAMLVTAYNADRNLFRIRFAIAKLQNYSSDENQKIALAKISDLMRDRQLVTLNANASALSPS